MTVENATERLVETLTTNAANSESRAREEAERAAVIRQRAPVGYTANLRSYYQAVERAEEHERAAQSFRNEAARQRALAESWRSDPQRMLAELKQDSATTN